MDLEDQIEELEELPPEWSPPESEDLAEPAPVEEPNAADQPAEPEETQEAADTQEPEESEAAMALEESDENIWSPETESEEETPAEFPEEAAELIPLETPTEACADANELQTEPLGSEAGPEAETENAPAGQADTPAETAEDSETRIRKLLGEPTAKLLAYLKSLSEELPPAKKEEFTASGLRDKIDELIGKLSAASLAERGMTEALTADEGGSDSGGGRIADPRRAADRRHPGEDRRWLRERRSGERRSGLDRRVEGSRREGDRRGGERRTSAPTIDLSESITPESASVKRAPDGTPTEIAGFKISPRLAKFIGIIKRSKRHE
jgi:hypothetical protein